MALDQNETRIRTLQFNPIVARQALLVVILFCLLQALVVRFSSVTQSSDAAAYIELAELTIKNGSWYPGLAEVHADYIFAPGYVNYLALLVGTLGFDIKSVLYANIVFNVCLLAATFMLSERLFSRRVAVISGLIFVTYLTNYGAVLLTLSDQLFCVLSYGALVLIFRKSLPAFIVAGVLLGIANWVRPLAGIFLVGAILISLNNRSGIRDLATLVAGFALTIGLIGGLSYLRMGYFVSGSTTSGVNLIIGANDDMTGGYSATVFEPGKIGYTENINSMTFEQRDEFYKSRAKQWIAAHPAKYISYMPVKLWKLYGTDHFFVGPLSGNYNMASLAGKDVYARVFYFSMIGINQIFYIALLSGAAWALIRSSTAHRRTMLIFFAVISMGAIVNLITYGAPRYHYPFMIFIVMMASTSIDAVIGSDWQLRRRARSADLASSSNQAHLLRKKLNVCRSEFSAVRY